MKSISMLEFRRNAERVLANVRRGERLVLTHRGKPVARLEPILTDGASSDDPFYSICDLAEPMGSLTNREMDALIYGE